MIIINFLLYVNYFVNSNNHILETQSIRKYYINGIINPINLHIYMQKSTGL